MDVFRSGRAQGIRRIFQPAREDRPTLRDLIPKESLATDQIEGIDQIMADAVAGKFIPAPLTSEQMKELVQFRNEV